MAALLFFLFCFSRTIPTKLLRTFIALWSDEHGPDLVQLSDLNVLPRPAFLYYQIRLHGRAVSILR